MTVWGVSIRIDRGQPIVVAVELNGPRDAPTAREVLRHRCTESDRALGLLELANDLDHELSKGPPAVLVVRSMDFFRGRAPEGAARPRLQAEGVVMQVARVRVARVIAASGRDIGDIFGTSKSAVEADAARLLPGLELDAVVAGLGALRLAEA
jgi:hypothetical protein